MSEVRVPQPKSIQAAIDLLAKYGINAPAVPIERIVKSEGARIQFGPLDKELSGMFFIKEGVPIIGVNSLHHPNRQRFTIAHEFGHMTLHRDLIGDGVHVDKELAVLLRDTKAAAGTDKIEIEANQFAAFFLVPDFLLDSAIGDNLSLADNEQEIELIAKKFKVSALMMQLRLRNWLTTKVRRG